MKIVVSSFGRCGSTMLSLAIYEAFPELHFGFFRNPDEADGIVKTHCWAPRELDECTKYIYLVGDPVLSLISVHNHDDDWQQKHYRNLGGCFEIRDFWDTEDVLHLEYHVLSWTRKVDQVLIVHMDDLWSPQLKISEFLGREVKIPEFVPRKTLFNPKDIRHSNAKETYGKLSWWISKFSLNK